MPVLEFDSEHRVGQRFYNSTFDLNQRLLPHISPGPQLKAGMVLAIEPMVSTSSAEVEILEDMWTAVTVDRQPAAHFEHTVAIRDGDPEILTLCRSEAIELGQQAAERVVGTRYGEGASD